MTITSAIVLYAVLWFLTLFLVLPFKVVTQAEKGEIVQGTPESAPHEAGMGRKLRLATIIATLLWAAISAVIMSGTIGIRDFDFRGKMPPEADDRGG